MRNSRELILAFVMWAVATCTLVFGVSDSLRAHRNSPSLGVAIFLAVAACVPTSIAIAQHYTRREDATVEQITEVVDALHQDGGDVSRIH